MGVTDCRVLLISPRYTSNNINMFTRLCEAVGARYPMSPLGLITVASLLPRSWSVRLIDRNTAELTMADIDEANVIMTGGMITQQHDTLDLIDLVQTRGKPVVVGGPDVTSSPHVYAKADFQVRGEAENIIGTFIEAWNSGARSGVFEGEKFQADVTKSPVPRYDLVRYENYLLATIQFSRGCPFDCEFCDIIELYGRVPRTKTPAQMLAEFDALYQAGHRGYVFFVDDNFIGNKKQVRQFLPQLKDWQQRHRYPFEFGTQATVNLADDPALLTLMREVNFITVFFGMESPDPEILMSMQKKQNAVRNLVDSVARVHAAGIFVHAGFIIGADGEKTSVADTIIDYIQATSITFASAFLLIALPITQLARRLAREGRIASRRGSRSGWRPDGLRAEFRYPASPPRHPHRLRDRSRYGL